MDRRTSPTDAVPKKTGLAPGALAELFPRTPFRKGTVLGSQGAPCDALYVILQGQVLVQRRNPEGEEYALFLLGPGELFGAGSLTPEGRWLESARFVTPGTGYSIPVAQIPRLTQRYPELLVQLLPLLGRANERAFERLDLINATSARERVLGLLRTMAGRHGKTHEGAVFLPLRLSQEELGAMLGLRRETVVRVMSELEGEGIIRRENRQGLWIEI